MLMYLTRSTKNKRKKRSIRLPVECLTILGIILQYWFLCSSCFVPGCLVSLSRSSPGNHSQQFVTSNPGLLLRPAGVHRNPVPDRGKSCHLLPEDSSFVVADLYTDRKANKQKCKDHA